MSPSPQMENCGSTLREASAWWIGDWLAYGQWRYGEKYEGVVEELGVRLDQPDELLAETRKLLSIINGKAPLAIARIIEQDPDVDHTHAVGQGVRRRRWVFYGRPVAEHNGCTTAVGLLQRSAERHQPQHLQFAKGAAVA